MPEDQLTTEIDEIHVQEIQEPTPTETETVYVLADPLMIEQLDHLKLQQETTTNLMIFLIGLICGIVFLKSLLKGWLDG